MALKFQPPNIPGLVQQPSDLSGSIDNIFNAYLANKARQDQDKLLGLQLRDKYGVDPRMLSQEQLNRGFAGPTQYQQQGPVPPGQAPLGKSEILDQDPLVAAVQSYVQRKKTGEKSVLEKSQLELDKLREDIGFTKAKREEISAEQIFVDPDTGKQIRVPAGAKLIPREAKSAKADKSDIDRQIKSAENANFKSTRAVGLIDKIIPRVNAWSAGLGSLASFVPTSDPSDLKEDVKTLRAALAFGALQDIRDASKTGGALGAVSEKELSLLESVEASLETKQSPEQLIRNLKTVRGSFERIQKASRLDQLRLKAGR